MALNHGINADDNNLAEIIQTRELAGRQVTEAKAIENKIAGFENNPQSNSGVIPRVQNAGISLQSGSDGGNHAKVYGGMIEAKLGMPSVELAGMALGIMGDRGGIFKSVKSGFDGKKSGYQKGTKAASIQTGADTKSGKLAFGVAVARDSITSSSKGVKSAKANVPNLKQEKAMIYAKKMAHTYGNALQAEAQKHNQIYQANQMGGGAPALVASLKNGPKFKMTDSDLERAKADNNIWGSSDTA